MYNNRLIIVGGGVSGLAAGVYARLSGFDTLLLERHAIVGGQCTGWERKGFHIDNCIHWLTGTNPKKAIYKIWERVGAFDRDTEFIRNESFLRVDGRDGRQHYVWRDIDRMKADMLALAPEDKGAIEEFIDAVDRYKDVEIFGIPFEQYTLWDYIRLIRKMRRVGKVSRKYTQMSIDELRDKFTNPLLRRAMDVYLPKQYYAEALFYMYGTFASDNGDIPKGGSRAMALRMLRKYEFLGGNLRLNADVEEIIIDHHLHCATGVRLANGEVLEADYVIAATDASVTLSRLLKDKIIDDFFKFRYNDKRRYPVFSNVVIYFGSNARPENMPDTVAFEEEPFEICGHQLSVILFKHYMYEQDYAPEGKAVMQVMLMQYEEDFDYWENLYLNDRERYKAEKQRMAECVRERVEKHFPELTGQLEVLEVVTPYSFHRWTGAYKGSYMSFIRTKNLPNLKHKGRVIGVHNLYLAGQWLQAPGGLPNALTTGKFAVQRLCKDHKIRFVE